MLEHVKIGRMKSKDVLELAEPLLELSDGTKTVLPESDKIATRK